MNHLQKAGSIAAFGLGALFITYLLLLMFVLPAHRVGPGTLNDPVIGLAFVTTSYLPTLIDFIYLGMAATFLLLVFALHERLGSIAPGVMRISAAAGVIASGLFLSYGMINFIGNPVAVHTAIYDVVMGKTLYLVLRTVANGLNAAALFAAGWSILLAGWTARNSRQLTNLLSNLLMGAGVILIGSFVLLPVGLLGVLLAPVWSIWLGIALRATNFPLAKVKQSTLSWFDAVQ